MTMTHYEVWRKVNGRLNPRSEIERTGFDACREYCIGKMGELSRVGGRRLVELAVFEVSLGVVYTIVDKFVHNGLGVTPDQLRNLSPY